MEMRWQQGLFPCSSISERGGRNALAVAGASRVGESCFDTLCGSLQCCCVWPMCVSEDKTCGGAQWKTAGHIWGSWKRAVRKVISRVLQQRPGGRDRAQEWQSARGETEPRQTVQNHCTRQNSWLRPPSANNQCRTVTESIIYFRTLDLSLRFLGR